MIKNKETINRKFNGLIFVTSSINKVIENTVEIRSKKENSPDTYLYSSKDKIASTITRFIKRKSLAPSTISVSDILLIIL